MSLAEQPSPALRRSPVHRLPRAELLRLVRFCAVGASNTAVTLVAFTTMVAVGTWSPAASAAAFVLGAINGYVWNTRWTFAEAQAGWAVATRYAAVQGVCAGLSAAGVVLARSDNLARLPAELVTIPGVTLIAYALSRTIVFRTATD